MRLLGLLVIILVCSTSRAQTLSPISYSKGLGSLGVGFNKGKTLYCFYELDSLSDSGSTSPKAEKQYQCHVEIARASSNYPVLYKMPADYYFICWKDSVNAFFSNVKDKSIYVLNVKDGGGSRRKLFQAKTFDFSLENQFSLQVVMRKGALCQIFAENGILYSKSIATGKKNVLSDNALLVNGDILNVHPMNFSSDVFISLERKHFLYLYKYSLGKISLVHKVPLQIGKYFNSVVRQDGGRIFWTISNDMKNVSYEILANGKVFYKPLAIEGLILNIDRQEKANHPLIVCLKSKFSAEGLEPVSEANASNLLLFYFKDVKIYW